jgi:hypothetical protein
MAQLRILAGLAMVWLAAPPAFAHHPFADEFDRSQSVTLTGTLTRLDWQTPHVYAYVDVKDAQGNATNWKIEMGSPDALTKEGWTRTSLKAGDQVTIQGWKSRRTMNLANAESFTMPDGTRMTAASSMHMAPEGQLARADQQDQPGVTAALPSDSREPQTTGDQRVGTTGAESESLPATASPLALFGVLGALALGGALGVRCMRR